MRPPFLYFANGGFEAKGKQSGGDAGGYLRGALFEEARFRMSGSQGETRGRRVFSAPGHGRRLKIRVGEYGEKQWGAEIGRSHLLLRRVNRLCVLRFRAQKEIFSAVGWPSFETPIRTGDRASTVKKIPS